MDNLSYQELVREFGLDDDELFDELPEDFMDVPEYATVSTLQHSLSVHSIHKICSRGLLETRMVGYVISHSGTIP